MTKPRYRTGCSAGSQENRRASSPADNAIYVNLHNGNVNWNNQNNRGRVRFCRRVRASECQSAEGVSLQELITAAKAAEAGKAASMDSMRFQMQRGRQLLELQRRINAGVWHPSPVTCFIADHPKTREIHAPAFADRVVHHLVVPKMVAHWEPKFIFDSYANRIGKGSHKAVTRVHQFVHEVESGQGGGYVLKLDIKNCFPSIDREILWADLKAGMQDAGLPMWMQRIVHALLRKPPLHYGVHYLSTPAERETVPPHKRLENAPPGRGIPIGNLSSQFFENVYMHPLDLFVKHVIKCKRYARYVDDFVLIHHSREQLAEWLAQIEAFLAERLHLELKAGHVITPLSQGVDFLGYVIFPTHIRVRPRVVAHARSKFSQWARRHVTADGLRITPGAYRQFTSVDASYSGHFRHANSHRLQINFERRFPWLPAARVCRRFHHSLEQQQLEIPFVGAMQMNNGRKARRAANRRGGKRAPNRWPA